MTICHATTFNSLLAYFLSFHYHLFCHQLLVLHKAVVPLICHDLSPLLWFFVCGGKLDLAPTDGNFT